MRQIDPAAVTRRLRLDNPWWSEDYHDVAASWPKRAYLGPFGELTRRPVQRAVVLLGARRVGKTTLLRQLIDDANRRKDLGPVMFASVDAPTYSGLSLEELLDSFERHCPHDADGPRLVVFDEIQYRPDWERELKDLVDRYPNTRFVASGSAGAALKRKSLESGAGRFTDFELPPLTFAEFLDFSSATDEVLELSEDTPKVKNAERLAELFVEYVNVGGYPEVVKNPAIRQDMERFVRNDIVQKVLLQDLPTLYGISNIPELNKLFTTLAYNTGQLVSMEELSKSSGIAKATIARYLEYLEAAFLILRLRRVDDNSRRLQRERNFKVYLTNPSMRAALFGPVESESEAMGALAETAFVTQYLHAQMLSDLCFARWAQGEVDVVRLDPLKQKPLWALEVTWSDRAHASDESWSALTDFARKNELPTVYLTARTASADGLKGSVRTCVRPLPLLCFEISRLAARQALHRNHLGLPES